MSYLETFEPERIRFDDAVAAEPRARGDARDGSVYVFTEPIVLAVKVALATGRPLLLYGAPGSGKSSLAAFVARTMGWNYYEQVVTSRTQAQDLQWSFDAVRRLRDAKAGGDDIPAGEYVEPRVLWWAFDSESASRRGLGQSSQGESRAESPAGSAGRADGSAEPSLRKERQSPEPPGYLRGADRPSVALIDEIDKADPDVPNDLLVVLGSQRFQVGETSACVKPKHTPLVVITSNDERELPSAFLRRCVVHTLEEPSRDKLVEIARQHFPLAQGDTADDGEAKEELFGSIADMVISMRAASKSKGVRSPSTAEYLDAIRACVELKVRPGDSPVWQAIESAVLVKRS